MTNESGRKLAWTQRYFLAEAEAHIELGSKRWNGCDPKVCGLIVIKWLRKALTA